MKVQVDAERCAGHALCWGEAPDVFPLDEEGYNALRGRGLEPLAAEHKDSALRGAQWCPEQASAIIEDDPPVT